MNKNTSTTIAIIVGVIFWVGKDGIFSKDIYSGYVYPDANDLTVHEEVGNFKSLEECRDAVDSRLRLINALEIGDSECGKNCKYNSRYGLNVCEETY